jgi:hypothetical protein
MDELNKVVKFLLGEAELDGFWFGTRKNNKTFWWREDLRKAVANFNVPVVDIKELDRILDDYRMSIQGKELTMTHDQARQAIIDWRNKNASS